MQRSFAFSDDELFLGRSKQEVNCIISAWSPPLSECDEMHTRRANGGLRNRAGVANEAVAIAKAAWHAGDMPWVRMPARSLRLWRRHNAIWGG